MLAASASEPAYVSSGVTAYREELRDKFARALVAEALGADQFKDGLAKLMEARLVASERSMPDVDAADAKTMERTTVTIDELLAKEKLLDAWAQGTWMVNTAQAAGHAPLREHVLTKLDTLYPRTVEAVRATLGNRAAIERGLALLERMKTALPGRAREVAALEQEIAPARARMASALVEEAGQKTRGQYAESERLITLALRLDPANERAKVILETAKAARAELQPAYVSDVRTRRDGAGIKIEFSLKNRAEKYTVVPGRAAVNFSVTSEGVAVANLGTKTFDIADANYKQRGSTVFIDVPRIAFDSLDDRLTGQGVGSGIFAGALRDSALRVTVEVVFSEAGAERGIAGTEVLTYHAFR